jgi:hypothetical protein
VRKPILALAILALIGISTPPIVAENLPGEQFRVIHPEVASIGVLIDDSTQLKKQFSAMQAFTGDKPGNTGNVKSVQNCFSYPSVGCERDKHINYQTMASYCSDDVRLNCVNSVVATGLDGIRHYGKYVEDFPGKTQYSFTGNIAAELPSSGSNFIISIPTLPHSQGDKYLVAVSFSGQKQGEASKFTLNNFQAGIFAVTVVGGSYKAPYAAQRADQYVNVGMFAGDSSGWDNTAQVLPACAQLTEDRCALAWPLPLNVNFEITLRLDTEINGWLHGRLQDANAKISRNSNGQQIVTISGNPVEVPIVYSLYPRSAVPKIVTNFYKDDKRFEIEGYRFGVPNSNETSIVKGLNQYESHEFPAALMWYRAISDTAPYAATAWSVRTIQNQNLGRGCDNGSKEISGLVTTNSNMYVAEPPFFNKKDMTLDYQVASPHYLPDGSVFKGSYNLVMRSAFARCVYGFTSAPISAKVSVLSSDGTSQIATTVLSERDGWLRLSASNFTFSSPTLKVKLSQAKKKAITCQKGGERKKITSANPICPAGFRKVVLRG